MDDYKTQIMGNYKLFIFGVLAVHYMFHLLLSLPIGALVGPRPSALLTSVSQGHRPLNIDGHLLSKVLFFGPCNLVSLAVHSNVAPKGR